MHPKKLVAITAIAVGILALAGCGDKASDTSTAQPKGFANTQPSGTPENTATTPPLVAETPSDDTTDADQKFLKYVHAELPAATSIPNATDEQLVAAGHDSCKQLRAGVKFEDVRVVKDEKPTEMGYYLDSSAIMNGSIIAYCTEFLSK